MIMCLTGNKSMSVHGRLPLSWAHGTQTEHTVVSCIVVSLMSYDGRALAGSTPWR